MHSPGSPAAHVANPAAGDSLVVPPRTRRANGRAPVAELEQRVRELEQELALLHRLALLGTMSAMAAHEWNNLATPVLARAEFALSGDDVAAARKALERTVINTKKSVAIAQHLLGLAKGDDRPIEACPLRASVDEAIEATSRPADKDRIDLRVDVAADVAVRANKLLLEQVLINLLLNARQAVQDVGGRITIAARREGEVVALEFRDTGRGIAEERLAGLFNPFLAARDDARPHHWHAVGLGLNVCRMIAQRHGATLHAAANNGQGCVFELRWPAA
ncbi:MAG: sensor histidine kinase [Phycisphaerae bacterium]